MIYLCIAAIGLTIFGLNGLEKTFWAIAEVIWNVCKKIKEVVSN